MGSHDAGRKSPSTWHAPRLHLVVHWVHYPRSTCEIRPHAGEQLLPVEQGPWDIEEIFA